MKDTRRCSISKKYFNRGYVILGGDFYAEKKEDLLDILKKKVDFQGLDFLNNEDFLNFAYEEGLYYYTEFD
tara:strand:+ start:143 stop:355 length:213 start_codon:yes stop_codon:yes gene_type:complete